MMTVVTINMGARAVSKIPSQSSQPSRIGWDRIRWIHAIQKAESILWKSYSLGERKTFDGFAVKSAFALLLTKVTKPTAQRREEKGLKPSKNRR